MTARIRLAEAETARLMRLAGMEGRAPLAISFGPGGVALQQDEEGNVESAWALPFLAAWRGLTVEDGLGI